MVGVSISALIVNLGGVDVKASHAYMWPAIHDDEKSGIQDFLASFSLLPVY